MLNTLVTSNKLSSNEQPETTDLRQGHHQLASAKYDNSHAVMNNEGV